MTPRTPASDHADGGSRRRRNVFGRSALAAALLAVTAAALALPTAPGADASRAATCHGKAATKVGTADADVITGTPGRDVILALGGDDLIRGRGGTDLICAGPGDDRIDGGRGRDRVDGGTGFDSCRATEASTSCEETRTPLALGPLAAGEWAAPDAFRPRIDFSVPAGWSRTPRHVRVITFAPTGHEATQTLAIIAYVGRSPDSLMQQALAQPGVTATTPVTRRIVGGLAAQQSDVTIPAGGPGEVLVPDGHSVLLAHPGDALRFVIVDHPVGAIAILVQAPEAEFPSLASQADTIISGMTFPRA